MFWWRRLKKVEQETKTLMATVDQLKADMTAFVNAVAAAQAKITADLATISATIQNLKNQAGSGVPISQADLDALDAQVQSASTGLSSIVAGVDTEAAQS